MIFADVFSQIPANCTEGLGLALADPNDGAIMHFQWCNRSFAQTIGFEVDEVVGKRGTILIGSDMDQATHLFIIERLMSWAQFTVQTKTNKKDGTPIEVGMTWTPLSDPKSSDRWWLCSLSKPALSDEILGGKVVELSKHSLSFSKAQKTAKEINLLRRENRRLQTLSQSVARVSTQDALTGLSNRRHFDIELRKWMSRAESAGAEFAVIYVDLDHFKLVNDNLGHDAGDQVLISAGARLREACEPDDFLARVGGDEFIILKQLSESALAISSVADKIVDAFGKPQEFDGRAVVVSASVGIALSSSRTRDPDELVNQADAALLQSKDIRRGSWSFFTMAMHAKHRTDKRMASDLLNACKRKEFFVLFQPVIEAQSGCLASVEVLVRWMHPEKGELHPGCFLELAQKIGVLGRIDQLAFEQACHQVSEAGLFHLGLPAMSVNVSSSRLTDPSFLHEIGSCGVQPKQLIVEVVESTYLDRLTPALQHSIRGLQDLGVSIAVDDFGTGHASLQGLLSVRPNIMKVDRHFIAPLPESDEHERLVSSIVGIGKGLDIELVAEGIETLEQADAAKRLGCDFLQGYYFGRPMTADQIAATFLQENYFSAAAHEQLF